MALIQRVLRPIVSGVLAASVLGGLAGCDSAAPETRAAPVTVSVLAVQAARLTLTDELPGRVAAVRNAEIRPQVGGIVRKRFFSQGAEVKAGQLLFQLDPAPFKADADSAAAALLRAQAVAARAELQVKRLQPLMQADAVSRQVFDDAVSAYDQAAADVAQARASLARRKLDLGFAAVRAPISGRIGEELVTEGALVGLSDASPLARIQQIDQVYVDVRQPAAMLEEIRRAASASTAGSAAAVILRADGTPYSLTGKQMFSGINVDPGTGDVLLRILVDNPRRELLPGMFVRARLSRPAVDKALRVPQQAVLRSGEQARVWVLGTGNAVSLRPVKVGSVVNQDYVLNSGLQAGESVVVEGQEALQEGMKVVPRRWQPAIASLSQR